MDDDVQSGRQVVTVGVFTAADAPPYSSAMDPLLALDPRAFEHLVADYLRDRGYTEIRHVTGVSDIGVDIRCKDEQDQPVTVQCAWRRPGAKVGLPEIRRFSGLVVHTMAVRGIVVTNSDFTAPAINAAREHGIEVIAGAAMRAFLDGRVRERRDVEAQAEAVHPPPVRSSWTILGTSVWWYVVALFVVYFLFRAFA